MSMPFDLVDVESWPRIKAAIIKERIDRAEGLLHIAPEGLRGQQQFIAALDWVLEQANPPQPDNEEPIYDE